MIHLILDVINFNDLGKLQFIGRCLHGKPSSEKLVRLASKKLLLQENFNLRSCDAKLQNSLNIFISIIQFIQASTERLNSVFNKQR